MTFTSPFMFCFVLDSTRDCFLHVVIIFIRSRPILFCLVKIYCNKQHKSYWNCVCKFCCVYLSVSYRIEYRSTVSQYVSYRSDSNQYSPLMVSYMSTIESLPLKSIISEILAIFSHDLENEVKGQIQGHKNIRHIWFPRGQRSNSRSRKHSPHMVSYMSTIDS